jgi:ParB/RepB/Spo0J family partition protein
MAAESNTPNTNGAHGRAELRHIPLAQITVQDGFNPRGEVADAELDAMAETMRERGCLQPVLVRSAAGETYLLVAGERRYRAATKAGLTDIPANVLPAGSGDEAERLELLTDAMIENELRSDLNPLQRAQGYKAMLDCGLNVRGVAERLGGKAKRSSRERRIKDHLTILALPDSLRRLIAAETIPLLAVKALVELCGIHEELARNAVAAVLNADEPDEAPTWSEFVNDALSIGVLHTDPLPAGLFQSNRRYPVGMFTLSERAMKNLAAFEKATAQKLEMVSFTPEVVEHARRLKAVHELGRWSQLIVGQDVGDALAEDYIAHSLKAARARIKAQREAEQAGGAAQPQPGAPAAAPDGAPAGTETEEERQERIQEEAKARRREQQERREQATRFNEAVGLLVFKHLSKIKVDERVLRILASVNLGGELWGIASRGARLALPGWISQTAQGNESAKTVYMDARESEERATRYLADAQSAGDIAGRALTLVALASLVDEEAVTMQDRSHYTLHFGGPLAAAAERDLNAIVRERIKEGQLPALDDILAERIAKDEENARRETEVAQALARLDGVSNRLDQLNGDELDQAIADAGLVWGEFHPKTGRLRDACEQRASDEDPQDAAQPEQEQVPAAA